MAIFNKGEEVICVDVSDGAEGILILGKTYIVLGPGKFCQCCIDVGVEWFCFETRFRRPQINEDVIETRERIEA